MILRILVALAVIFLVWWLVRRIMARFAVQRQPAAADRGLRVSSVRCAHCGLFLPETDAVQSAGHYFCCAEHRDAMKDNGMSP